jgi:hypothetical protein
LPLLSRARSVWMEKCAPRKGSAVMNRRTAYAPALWRFRLRYFLNRSIPGSNGDGATEEAEPILHAGVAAGARRTIAGYADDKAIIDRGHCGPFDRPSRDGENPRSPNAHEGREPLHCCSGDCRIAACVTDA